MRDKDARSWCRIGEALALDWSNVRLHEQSARIGMSKNGETPGHSIAIIPRIWAAPSPIELISFVQFAYQSPTDFVCLHSSSVTMLFVSERPLCAP